MGIEKEIEKLNGKMFLMEKSNKMVLLFGWFGSSHKLLLKYSEIYNKNEISSIQFTPSNFNITNSKHYEEKITKLFHLLQHHFKISQDSNFKIYFHCFSNHGLKNYISFTKLVHKKVISNFKIHGLIADSCPVNLNANSAAHAISASSKSSILAFLTFWGSYILFTILFFTYNLFYRTTPNDGVGFEKIKSHQDTSALFLYSEEDKITDFKFLERFIKEFKGRKTMKKFHRSPHVSHLILHPKEYETEVLTFILKGE
jgi:hypothetical protein